MCLGVLSAPAQSVGLVLSGGGAKGIAHIGVIKALEEPVRQIAANAGQEGSVIVDKIKNSPAGTGCNFATGEYVDMIESGIVDPAKVTRSALQNAASVASMVLTTESLVTDIKDSQADAAAAAAMAAASQGGMY